MYHLFIHVLLIKMMWTQNETRKIHINSKQDLKDDDSLSGQAADQTS